MSDDWCNLGLVAGIFWIRGLGIRLSLSPNLDGYRTPSHAVYRFWPFIFVWVPLSERHGR